MHSAQPTASHTPRTRKRLGRRVKARELDVREEPFVVAGHELATVRDDVQAVVGMVGPRQAVVATEHDPQAQLAGEGGRLTELAGEGVPIDLVPSLDLALRI